MSVLYGEDLLVHMSGLCLAFVRDGPMQLLWLISTNWSHGILGSLLINPIFYQKKKEINNMKEKCPT